MQAFNVLVLISAALCCPCDVGCTIFAPFPVIGSYVQATVISPIIDGAFIVEWFGSPELCSDPSARGKCIVDASMAYNEQVYLTHSLKSILRVFTVLSRPLPPPNTDRRQFSLTIFPAEPMLSHRYR